MAKEKVKKCPILAAAVIIQKGAHPMVSTTCDCMKDECMMFVWLDTYEGGYCELRNYEP